MEMSRVVIEKRVGDENGEVKVTQLILLWQLTLLRLPLRLPIVCVNITFEPRCEKSKRNAMNRNWCN